MRLNARELLFGEASSRIDASTNLCAMSVISTMLLASKPTCDQPITIPATLRGGFTLFGLLRLYRGDTYSAAIKRRSRCGCVLGVSCAEFAFLSRPRVTSRAIDSLYLSENRLLAFMTIHDVTTRTRKMVNFGH